MSEHYVDATGTHWIYARYSGLDEGHVVWKYDFQNWTQYIVPHFIDAFHEPIPCLLYTSPSPRDS